MKRFRTLVRVDFFDLLGKFVGGTVLAFAPPVLENIEKYCREWKRLNPTLLAHGARYKFLGAAPERERDRPDQPPCKLCNYRYPEYNELCAKCAAEVQADERGEGLIQ